MAASSSVYGSRKGLSYALPFLTGKAVFQITNFLHRGCEYKGVPLYSDEAVLLTGILFCGLSQENNEGIIKSDDYNMNFVLLKDDPSGCVQTYLEENNISGERMGELIDISFEKGYLQKIPPFFGKIEVVYPNGSKILNKDKFGSQGFIINVDPGIYISDTQIDWDVPISWYHILYYLIDALRDGYIDSPDDPTMLDELTKLLNSAESIYGRWLTEGLISKDGDVYPLVIYDE